MKKHIIITKLFEFGGSNSHLRSLIKYFGKENIVLVLEQTDQLSYLKNIEGAEGIKIKICSGLHQYAHLRYHFTTNAKEFFSILRSIFIVQLLSIKYGLADVTICSVDPEKYLYLLWLPFSRAIYILHSTPTQKYTSFTSYTCNARLGRRKKIISVSQSNKNLICNNWTIADKKDLFVYVVPNCLLEIESGIEAKIFKDKPNSNELNIITLGHVIAYKNPVLWLEVAKQVTAMFPNICFLWIGNGPLWEEFKAKTKGLERVFFIGVVPDPETYLKEAIVYYQPSLSETQGIAVIEAMNNALPCVVSNTGGLPETVANGYNGIVVDPELIEEHVKALTILIDNPDLRLQYGLNARKRASELYNFATFKTKMDAVYGH